MRVWIAPGSVAAAALAVLASLATGMVSLSGQQPSPRRVSYVPNEILVRFRSGASSAQRDAAVVSLTANVVRRFSSVGVAHARLRPGMSMQTALAIMQSNPDVLAVQPNYIRHSDAPAPPDDPYWLNDSLWGHLRIQAPAVWNTFTTGSPAAVVADIDSGVNYSHPDLAANMWRNPGEVPGNGIDDDRNGYVDDVYGIDVLNDDSDPMDDNGHGTHTAGTIGAIGNNGLGVVGINWNTRILACKFLNPSGNGTDSGAIECFNYIVALKNRGENIRVSTNSWGGRREAGSPFPQALEAAIDAASAAGILNVFAAGNNGANNDVTPFDPGSFTSPGIIAVAASDNADVLAGFSNYGATSVDLAAPGVGIWSTYGNGYAPLSGTSMATPHVAGAAALLLAQQPQLTVADLKSLLLANVDPLPQWSGLVATGGRLNVYNAMLASTPNAAPSVALTAPADGAILFAPAVLAMAATASDGDGSIARVDFVVNGSVAASDASAPYDATLTNVPAGTYSIAAVAVDNVGAATTSPTRTVTVSTPTAGSGATATFMTTDTTTLGSWMGVYGGAGFVIAADVTSLPGDVQISSIGANTWTWAGMTGDERALERAGGGRVMAALYGVAFALDINVSGTEPRQIAIYVDDYDNWGRQQQFDLIEASTGALLDRRVISGFSGGRYLVWNILGHVRVGVSALSWPNAVISGVLVGPASGGYGIAGDVTSPPTDAQMSSQRHLGYVSGQPTR